MTRFLTALVAMFAFATTAFAQNTDADADGYTVDEDCDDNDATIGAPNAPNDCDDDGSTWDVDCDDYDVTIYPGADEIADDGIDQDCDGTDAKAPPAADDDDADVHADPPPVCTVGCEDVETIRSDVSRNTAKLSLNAFGRMVEALDEAYALALSTGNGMDEVCTEAEALLTQRSVTAGRLSMSATRVTDIVAFCRKAERGEKGDTGATGRIGPRGPAGQSITGAQGPAGADAIQSLWLGANIGYVGGAEQRIPVNLTGGFGLLVGKKWTLDFEGAIGTSDRAEDVAGLGLSLSVGPTYWFDQSFGLHFGGGYSATGILFKQDVPGGTYRAMDHGEVVFGEVAAPFQAGPGMFVPAARLEKALDDNFATGAGFSIGYRFVF